MDNLEEIDRFIKKNREKNQINKNEKGKVTTDNAEIQRIIRDYYEHYMSMKWIIWKKWIDS